jgi:sugar lactone lactonase YvrE
MKSHNWTVIAQEHDKLGESAMWRPAEQAIYWVDWYGPTLRRRRGGDPVQSWTFSGFSILGSFTFATGGQLLLALNGGIKIFDPVSGRLRDFADPNQGREGVAYNDGKIDRQGRLWIGTFDVNERDPRGILYCVDGAGNVHVADSGYAVCNGPAFSPAGNILYFSDSMGKRIIAYDVDPATPQLRNRRIFADLAGESGLPDGLTVDAEGHLWCALYGAGRVVRLAPDGSMRASYTLPAANVTSCAFGGPSMTTLFVTSGEDASSLGKAGTPRSDGALFACELGIRGLVEPEFNLGAN